MKKFLLALIVLFVAYPAYAETVQVLDAHKHHSHRRNVTVHDEPGDKYGIGADVILWANGKENSTIKNVKAEYRRDFKNDNHSVYGVVEVSLWKHIKGLFKKGE